MNLVSCLFITSDHIELVEQKAKKKEEKKEEKNKQRKKKIHYTNPATYQEGLEEKTKVIFTKDR